MTLGWPLFRAVERLKFSLNGYSVTTFGRDGTRDDEVGNQGPLAAGPEYRSLLQQTLSSSASYVRLMRTWLMSLLHRTNLAGIVKELVTPSHACDVDLGGVYIPARAVLAILWPLAVKRAGIGASMECFAAVQTATYVRSKAHSLKAGGITGVRENVGNNKYFHGACELFQKRKHRSGMLLALLTVVRRFTSDLEMFRAALNAKQNGKIAHKI
ncbi:hypothetical protein EDD16DRAFT_1556143 [Pisolithus croceorrhizus]|nr:hypothetical protein EDD16DRAFT_1556143 [Pisolithus croceorrhizus]